MVRLNTRVLLRELETLPVGVRLKIASELPDEPVFIERDGSMWLVQLGEREAALARSPRMAVAEIRSRLRLVERSLSGPTSR